MSPHNPLAFDVYPVGNRIYLRAERFVHRLPHYLDRYFYLLICTDKHRYLSLVVPGTRMYVTHSLNHSLESLLSLIENPNLL